jgi:hypothetical protein
MAWRRRGRRGRPKLPDAKRRRTTASGRAPADTGSALLRARKRAVTGREDLELTGAAVLLGHDLLDRSQYDTLAEITLWLETMARAWGGLGGVTGLWYAITGAAVPTGFVRREDAGLAGLADQARRRLQRVCRQLDGSRELVTELASGAVPPIVLRVLDRALTQEDAESLERLRQGLDAVGGERRGRSGSRPSI